ncbi:hypothetical protein [Lentilitoribacter sp. Alg239-R112]|uniref:hypothetical protein n=1 Tax=Lentilitoribacter sp. Alg239-R112 TaxID=2305987 RepID=UPI0013A6BD81|nr:hypothetical protein [Lentilitoribacter sp. Alg239-R112]
MLPIRSFILFCCLFAPACFSSIIVSTKHVSAAVTCDAIKAVWSGPIWNILPTGYKQNDSYIPYDPPIFGEGCNSGISFSRVFGEPIIRVRLQVYEKVSAKSAQMLLGSNYDSSGASNPRFINSIGDIGGFSTSWRKNTYNNTYISATKGKYILIASMDSEIASGSLIDMTARLIRPLYDSLSVSPAGRETSFPPTPAPSASQDNCPANSVDIFGVPSSNDNCDNGSGGDVASIPQVSPQQPSSSGQNDNNSTPEDEPRSLSRAEIDGTEFEDFKTNFYKVVAPEGRQLIIYTDPTSRRAEVGRLANGTTELKIADLTKSMGYIWAYLCHERDCGYVVANHLQRQASVNADVYASTGESDVEVYMQPSVHEELVTILPYGFRVSVWEYAENVDGYWIYVCKEDESWCGWAEQDRFFRED